MNQKSKAKRFIALFVAIAMMASMILAVPAFASTFDLGDFTEITPDGWQHRWNTTGLGEVEDSNYPSGTLPYEIMQAATQLVLDFTSSPPNNIEIIVRSDYNNMGWNQRLAFNPEHDFHDAPFAINLTELAAWNNAISGTEGQIILGSAGLASALRSAHLVHGPVAATTPAPPAEAPPVEAPPVVEPPVEAPPAVAVPISEPIALFTPMPAPVPTAGREVLQLMLGSTTFARNGFEFGELEVAPASVGGRTMVPFRFIGEALGAEIDWEAATETAIFIDGANVVRVPIGVPLYDGGQYMGTPVIQDGRTLVPVRFVSAAMGAQVEWVAPATVFVIFGNEGTPVEVNDFDDYDEYEYYDEAYEDEYYDDYEEAYEDEYGNGEEETAEAVEVELGQASGYVLRHTHGTNWGQVVLTHDFTDDDYTITLVALHTSSEFGVDPADGADIGYNFLEDGETMESTRADSLPNVWVSHSFTFPGAMAGGGIQIAPLFPRAVGATFYIDNVVVTNSAGTVVFSNDFESNMNGFSIREWSEDTQARVPMP
jgi:hypothetical protein